MKRNFMLPLALFIAAAICFQTASAQFPIKIPKINKPKVEQPKTGGKNAGQSTEDANSSAPNAPKQTENRPAQTSKDQPNNLDDPERPKVPQILLETLEIKAHNQAKYWKTPKDNDNPSWFPQVSFQVFYAADMPTLRYMAEWSNPDGSPWFSEPLEMNYSQDFPDLRSPYEGKDLEPKAIIAGGNLRFENHRHENESDDFSREIQSQ